MDFPDDIGDILRIVANLFPELVWVLVALAGFVISSFNRARRSTQGGGNRSPSPARQARQPTPAAPPVPTWRPPATAPAGAEPATPRQSRWSSYGSRDKAEWRSVFDDPREEPKWGFDESEWGSAFGPKRDSEPTISRG